MSTDDHGFRPYWARVLMGALGTLEAQRTYERRLVQPLRPPVSEYAEAVERAARAYERVAASPPPVPAWRPLDEAPDVVARVRDDPIHGALFRFQGAEVAWIPLRSLVIRQPFVGDPYGKPAPLPGDVEGALAYAFPDGSKDPAAGVVQLDGSVVSETELAPSTVPLRATGDGPLRFEVTFQPPSRALRVAIEGDRAHLVNGVHRAFALLGAGWEEVPAVVFRARPRKPPVEDGMGAQGPDRRWYWREPQPWFGDRPPRLVHLADPDLSLHLPLRRLVYRYRARVEFEGEPVSIPDALYDLAAPRA